MNHISETSISKASGFEVYCQISCRDPWPAMSSGINRCMLDRIIHLQTASSRKN